MTTVLNHLQRMMRTHYQVLLAYVGVFTVLAVALLYRLGSLLPGYSAHEVQTYQASLNLHLIWAQPLNAPFHLLVYGLHFFVPHNLIIVRLASAAVGWLTLLAFCVLVHHWYGTRAATLGTLLFGLTPWFLHTARLGTPTVSQFGLLLLIACGVWFRERKAPLGVFIGLILAAALVYTPGMIWLMLIGVIWQWKAIDRAFTKTLGAVTLGGLLFLAILVPLGWHFYKTPHLIKAWLALPAHINVLHMLSSVVQVPLAIAVRGHTNPETWLGQLPLLSVFSLCMLVLGIYVYGKQARPGRISLIIGLSILTAIVVAVTGHAINLTVLVPFVFLLVTTGLCYLLELWLGVFPRNPIARSMGIGLITLLVGMNCVYNVRSYFVAWPQASVTQAVFTQRQP